MNNFNVKPICEVCNDEKGTYIKIQEDYIPALLALDGFSHIDVLWWFSEYDNEKCRNWYIMHFIVFFYASYQ